MYALYPATEEEVRSGGGRWPPPALLIGYARFCAGGMRGAEVVFHRLAASDARILGWVVSVNQAGRLDALPDRMYGLVRPHQVTPLDLDETYRALRMTAGGTFRANLPPAELSGPYVSSVKTRISRYHSHDTHVLFADSEDAAWQKVERVGRQGVRKAEREGVVVVRDVDTGTLLRYLSLHVDKSSRHGSPALTRAALERMQAIFEGSLRLSLAVLNRQAIAAVLWVIQGDYAILIDNASQPASWHLNPNNLVVWDAIRTAIAAGARAIDYGFGATDDAGGALFKQHMGGQKAAVYAVTAG